MYEFFDKNNAGHRQDHRVIKAIMLNGANRTIPKRFGGGAWAQTKAGAGTSASPLSVSASLDPELGAGLLDTRQAMYGYQPWELKATANNAAAKSVIDASQTGNLYAWDFEQVTAQAAGVPGRVDYQIGEIPGQALRATLTWDKIFDDGTGTKANLIAGLELKLYHEGTDVGNPAGFDVNDDLIAATTLNAAANLKDNVKLFDMMIPNEVESAGYYLEVYNPSNLLTPYAIAFAVPEPTTIVVLVLSVPMLMARRRRV